MKHQLLSLFSGAGGLDHGFHSAGFSTALAVDKCEDAIRTFNANFDGNVAVCRDLAKLKPAEFLKLVPSGAQPVGLIGGPPCQGFSRANVLADPDDPRNLLPFRYADLLAAANSRFNLHFFVFENVAGLLYSKHSKRLGRIRKRLSQAGFEVFVSELDASGFSVPQRRRRLFIVGLNRKLYPGSTFEFPTPSNDGPPTVAQAIKSLPKPVFYSRGLTPENIPFHPNHWTMVPKSTRFLTGDSTDGRSFKRLKWNEVSPTVAYGNREIHVHPSGDRRLTVLEAMLLQGFPQSFKLTGTLSAQVTQVSNAVPPPVAAAIAFSLRALLESRQSSGQAAGAQS